MINFNEMMTYMNITQGRYTYPAGTHRNAYDLAGKDTGIDKLYVPKNQTIKCIDFQTIAGANYSFYEFGNKVTLKNGKKVTLQMMCLHGWGIDYRGNTYKSGEVFYDEGTMGNASGNHVHIEFGTGFKPGVYGLKDNGGVWVANFTEFYNIEDVFYVTKNVMNDQGYSFRNKDVDSYTSPITVKDDTHSHRYYNPDCPRYKDLFNETTPIYKDIDRNNVYTYTGDDGKQHTSEFYKGNEVMADYAGVNKHGDKMHKMKNQYGHVVYYIYKKKN